MAFIELVVSTTAFWTATGAVFRANNPRTGDTKDNRMKEALIRLPYARVTWICALFLLGYVGIEVALGGWIVKWSVACYILTNAMLTRYSMFHPPLYHRSFLPRLRKLLTRLRWLTLCTSRY
jgi:fucose permease